MAVLDSILIAVAAIVLWCLLLYVLQSRGLLERRGLSPSPPPAGPFLMWKTVRGRQLIDRIARRNVFWRWFGDLAIVLVAVTMVGTTLLLLWEATLVQSSAVRANPPSPELLLGLPGINPIIPVGYGIFGGRGDHPPRVLAWDPRARRQDPDSVPRPDLPDLYDRRL